MKNIDQTISELHESVSEIMSSIESVRGPQVAHIAQVLLAFKQSEMLMLRLMSTFEYHEMPEHLLEITAKVFSQIELLLNSAMISSIKASGVGPSEVVDILPQLYDIAKRIHQANEDINT